MSIQDYKNALSKELDKIVDEDYKKRLGSNPTEKRAEASKATIPGYVVSGASAGSQMSNCVPVPGSKIIFGGIGALVGLAYGCYKYREDYRKYNAYQVEIFLATHFTGIEDYHDKLAHLADEAIDYRAEKIEKLADDKDNKNINLVAHYFAVNIMKAIKDYQGDPQHNSSDVAGAGLAQHKSRKCWREESRILKNGYGNSTTLKALAEFGTFKSTPPMPLNSTTSSLSPSITA